MAGGIELMRFYLNEWLTLAGKLQAYSTDVAEPRRLWEWLARRRDAGSTTFTLRDAYNSGPRFLRNQSQKARDSVAELLRRGYVRMQGKAYEIRPANELRIDMA